MNEVIQNILTRRSVRAYKDEQIADADLEIILEAAKFAPVGDDPKVRNLLTELGVPENYAVYGSAALGFSSGDEQMAAPRKEGTVNIVK